MGISPKKTIPCNLTLGKRCVLLLSFQNYYIYMYTCNIILMVVTLNV